MEQVWKEISRSFGSLTRNPGFAASALLTLALGIGANSAIFSVVSAVLLRPLPYEDPGRLVTLSEVDPNGAESPVAPANYLDWKQQSTVFEELAAFGRRNVSLTGGSEPLMVPSATVSPSVFRLLGLEAHIGRTFDGQEAGGDEREVVLGHALWSSHFGADPAIVGRSLKLDGEIYTVIGIAPQQLEFPREPDLFIRAPQGVPVPPWPVDGDLRAVRDLHYFDVLARLKPGVSVEQAQAQMDTIANRVAASFPDENRGRGVKVTLLWERMLGPSRPVLLALFGAVGFVLLIACTNVTSLLLTRATVRERETAIRTALGADRRHLLRQFVTESLLLALLGGGLGLLLGIWSVDLLVTLNPRVIPRLEEARIDGGVVGFTLMLSLVTGLIVGVLPAAQASKPDLQGLLKEGGTKSTASGRSRRLFKVLVVAEVSVTLVLLVGAGLLIKSLLSLNRVDPGFDASQVLTLRVTLPELKYSEENRWTAFFREAVARVRNIPDVEAAAASSDLPASGGFAAAVIIEGQPRPGPGEQILAGYHAVTPGYFRAMGIPLLVGRDFDSRDSETGAKVMVINQTMAGLFWPDGNPIGRRIGFDGEDGAVEWFSIIGVAADVRYSGLEKVPDSDVFVSFRQAPERAMMIIVRAKHDPADLVASVKEQIFALDKEQPIDRIRTMDEILAASTAERRFASFLLAILAGVALGLALVGIYGVISYSVGQRTHEIGVRMALGARRAEILYMFLREAALLGLMGIGLGLLSALSLTGTMSSLLFGVSALEMDVFAAISLGLAVVVLLASYIPARRAMGVEPVLVLQHE